MSDLDRLQAQARADATAVIARAATYERQLDAIDEFLARLLLGRLHAICSTLAEHQADIDTLKAAQR